MFMFKRFFLVKHWACLGNPNPPMSLQFFCLSANTVVGVNDIVDGVNELLKQAENNVAKELDSPLSVGVSLCASQMAPYSLFI